MYIDTFSGVAQVFLPLSRRTSSQILVVAFAVLATVIVSTAVRAEDLTPDIGIFADPEGSQCVIQHNAPGVGRFYVVATLGGAASDGIKAAEFGVRGFPDDWVVNVTPGPAAVTMLWNPVAGGGSILYEACEAGDGARVLLATVNYYAPRVPHEGTVLSLTRNGHRVDPAFQCPLVKRCVELPAEVRICVPGSDAVLNGETCPVAVATTTWSSFKKLYNLHEAVYPAR